MSNENPAQTPAPTYDASSIQVLEGLEAVRKRPSMYIGSTDYKGLHHLVYEVVDNSIDEALAGYCNNIEVSINENGSVTVTDDGRGIPVEMHEKYKKPALEIVMTMLHAGGKFDNRTYKVSGGLHGVGVSVVNALSRYPGRRGQQERKGLLPALRAGKARRRSEGHRRVSHTGTKTTFMPDNAIFETLEFQYDILANRLRELAYLNKGIKITLTDKKANKSAAVPLRGRHRPVHRLPERGQERAAPAPDLLRAGEGHDQGRDRHAVQRWLQRGRPGLRQQHQHSRGRHPPERLPRGADPLRQRLREEEQPDQGRNGALRRRYPRGADRHHQRQADQSRSSKARRRPSWATAT